MKVIVLLSLLAVGLAAGTFRKVQKDDYSQIAEPWAGGELQVSFSPTFTKLGDGRWPKGWRRGAPYRVSVMWVRSQAGETQLRVEKFRIKADQQTIDLSARETSDIDENHDRRFYTIIAYENIDLAADTLTIDFQCSIKSPSGHGQKHFVFEVKRASRTRWVNTILEAIMGI